MEELEFIKELMKHILLSDKGGKWRPIKGTTKEQCYAVLGAIQMLLDTNFVRCDDDFMKGNQRDEPLEKLCARFAEKLN